MLWGWLRADQLLELWLQALCPPFDARLPNDELACIGQAHQESRRIQGVDGLPGRRLKIGFDQPAQVFRPLGGECDQALAGELDPPVCDSLELLGLTPLRLDLGTPE